jgi:hypothetical protein
VYEKHPVFEEPVEEATLWRYMTLGRLISLLSHQALYFCRVDELQDVFEGRLPKPTYDLTDPHLRTAYEDTRVSTILSCWSIGEHESVALWKTYVAHGEGVALRSTFARLRDSFRPVGLFEEARVHIGLVRYVSFDEHNFVGSDGLAFNAFVPLVHKRPYFEYEREVRAAISGLGTHFLGTVIRQTPGMYVPVDIKGLIAAVHVPPEAPEWFKDAVTAAMERFGLDPMLVRQSAVDAPPPGPA